MRSKLFILLPPFLPALFLLAACSNRDCLPEPGDDDTPPEVRIRVDFRSTSGELRTVEHAPEERAATIQADAGGPVILTYFASDPSGLRSLSPAITIQQTVGVGVERRYVPVNPVEANCPTATLTYRHELPGSGRRRALVVTAGAENWVGRIGTLEPLTIRLE